MKMTHQKRVMQILENNKDWLTVAELANIAGIAEANMRNVLRLKAFEHLEVGIKDTGQPHGGRYVRVYRLPKFTRSTDDALELSKQHPGVFGQLFWANDAKIELMK